VQVVGAEAPTVFGKGLHGRQGKVLIGTGLLSRRASTTQTSFGQSFPSGWTHSSLTMRSSRPKSGSTVCVNPV